MTISVTESAPRWPERVDLERDAARVVAQLNRVAAFQRQIHTAKKRSEKASGQCSLARSLRGYSFLRRPGEAMPIAAPMETMTLQTEMTAAGSATPIAGNPTTTPQTATNTVIATVTHCGSTAEPRPD